MMPDDRVRLQSRLAIELADPALADSVVAGLGDALVGALVALCDGDIDRSRWLSYRPPTVSLDDIDALLVFAYGYRFRVEHGSSDTSMGPPPMEALSPGPVNEVLASIVEAVVAARAVPVIAQWEVAAVLADRGVVSIPVEPDISADGSVVYLSTAQVADKGLRLAADAGIVISTVGVVAHNDHAVRCVLTVEQRGVGAAVPAGADLPTGYDVASGQEWTRSRAAFVPVDLFARALVRSS